MGLFFSETNPWHTFWQHQDVASLLRHAALPISPNNQRMCLRLFKFRAVTEPKGPGNDLIYVQQAFYTNACTYTLSIHAKGFELFTLPGCVCQGEAPLGEAPVHQEFAEQQRRVAGGVSRRVTRGHPGGSTGWARSWLWFQPDGLSAAEWEGVSLLGAIPEGLTHAATQWFISKTFVLRSSLVQPSRFWQVVRVIHLRAAAFFKRIHKITLWPVS